MDILIIHRHLRLDLDIPCIFPTHFFSSPLVQKPRHIHPISPYLVRTGGGGDFASVITTTTTTITLRITATGFFEGKEWAFIFVSVAGVAGAEFAGAPRVDVVGVDGAAFDAWFGLGAAEKGFEGGNRGSYEDKVGF
jgi:hypothetical protein